MSNGSARKDLSADRVGNPILTAKDFPATVNTVFNPGAVVVDGRTLLLLRVEYRTGLSALAVATSEDGLTGWEIDPLRGLAPAARILRGALGGGRPADNPDRRHVLRRLHRLLGGRAADLPGEHPRLPALLLTKDGWLLCYHGVRHTVSGSIYRLGLALLDRDDPAKILARGQEWVFGPSEPYERQGDVPAAVFPCGWILRDDGDTLHVYYGAADSVVCVAQAALLH